MKFLNLLIIPVFMSFWDCNKPREPAQPVSDKTKISSTCVFSQAEWNLKKLLLAGR